MEDMDRTNQATVGRRRGAALAAAGVALAVTVVVVFVQRDDDSSTAEVAGTLTATSSSPPSPPTRSPSPSPSTDPPEVDPERNPRQRVDIPERGRGRFERAPGRRPQVGRGTALRYTVAVERGLPYAPADVAPVVDATLADPRGWTKDGLHAFRRVPHRPDIRVLLASPDTTDELCAPLQTRGRVSCRNGALVVLNARRWAYGIPDYDGDLRRYRQYVVNHEVGHALGAGHVECPGPGRRAPLMQQQSYGLDGCRPNAWPR